MTSLSKKCAMMALAAICGASLCACSPSEEESNQQTATANQDLLDAIQSRGKIVIATEGTWAPWTFHDESGKLTGYDIELGLTLNWGEPSRKNLVFRLSLSKANGMGFWPV